MQDINLPKLHKTYLFMKILINFITTPHLQIDEIEKKCINNKISYYVKFVIVRRRQPFIHSVDYIINNITAFNFSNHNIAILAYYQMYQTLENMEIKNFILIFLLDKYEI